MYASTYVHAPYCSVYPKSIICLWQAPYIMPEPTAARLYSPSHGPRFWTLNLESLRIHSCWGLQKSAPHFGSPNSKDHSMFGFVLGLPYVWKLPYAKRGPILLTATRRGYLVSGPRVLLHGDGGAPAGGCIPKLGLLGTQRSQLRKIP